MLVKMKGLLIGIGPKETTDKGTEIVKLYLKVPEKINEFGEVYQKETTFEIKAIGKQIGKITDIKEKLNKGSSPVKVELTAFLNSLQNEYDGKVYYNVNLSLAKIEIL